VEQLLLEGEEPSENGATDARSARGGKTENLYLILTHGKQKGLPVAVPSDLFLIGADPNCQLRSDSPGMGTQHCCIVTRDRKNVFVRDLDSGEATFVNGELVPPAGEWPLHSGDRFSVGPLEFLVQFRETPLSQRDLEEWGLKCLDEDAAHSPREYEEDIFTEYRPSYTASTAAANILDKLQAQKGIVKGRLRVGLESGIWVVRFNDVYLVAEGEIALVKKELYDHLTAPNMKVLLDFKNVRRMSSCAVQMVLEVSDWAARSGSKLVLCRIRPDLKGVLETLRLTAALRHFNDKAAALAAPW
jgi:anti-anti-sigma regulatory factor